jgi:2',3'-cyclic-nucleotide 2'-phosphodiesterase (5'-nucleotidase family)
MLRTAVFLLCAALLACSPRTYQSARSVEAPAASPVPVVRKAAAPAIPPRLDERGDTIVGHSDLPLTKAQPESSLGNFVTDAMLAAAQKMDKEVVCAICNYGGIRLDYLPPGPITKAQLRQLMPFDNVLVIVEMSGTALQEFCNLMARRKGWPLSGLSFLIKNGTATEVRVQGEMLNPGRVYKVTVSNYLSKGGDQCSFLPGLPAKKTRVLIRNALEDLISAFEQEGKPLQPVIEQRVHYAD